MGLGLGSRLGLGLGSRLGPESGLNGERACAPAVRPGGQYAAGGERLAPHIHEEGARRRGKHVADLVGVELGLGIRV